MSLVCLCLFACVFVQLRAAPVVKAISEWRFKADRELVTTSDWHAFSFDDLNWDIGTAPIGAQDPLFTFRKSIDGSTPMWFRFRQVFPTVAATLAAAPGITLLVASNDNATVWLNEKLVSADLTPHPAAHWNQYVSLKADDFNGDNNILAVQLANTVTRDGVGFSLEIALEDLTAPPTPMPPTAPPSLPPGATVASRDCSLYPTGTPCDPGDECIVDAICASGSRCVGRRIDTGDCRDPFAPGGFEWVSRVLFLHIGGVFPNKFSKTTAK